MSLASIILVIAITVLVSIATTIIALKIFRKKCTKNTFCYLDYDSDITIFICPDCWEIIQSPGKGEFKDMQIVEAGPCEKCLSKLEKAFIRNRKFCEDNNLKYHKIHK